MMTCKEIVKSLDNYIVGQAKAKRAVAIALRNRYRRSKLPQEMREEITPKNIIMQGPTGVGKTEIARRLAKLVKAPFVKVEATKFTEVGYVGRDVESMIRDLAECSVRLVKEERFKKVREKATATVDSKLVKIIADLRRVERGEIEFKNVNFRAADTALRNRSGIGAVCLNPECAPIAWAVFTISRLPPLADK